MTMMALALAPMDHLHQLLHRQAMPNEMGLCPMKRGFLRLFDTRNYVGLKMPEHCSLKSGLTGPSEEPIIVDDGLLATHRFDFLQFRYFVMF